MELGARIAEAIFTAGLTLEASQKFLLRRHQGRMGQIRRITPDRQEDHRRGSNAIVGRTRGGGGG